ncbi:MAG: response regulator transcription factor [Bacteroidetes bacterium]|nr:response regulator transcription factor [Bacteroidota bacterium]
MKPKILLVEDDNTLGYILKEYLEMKDFIIHWTVNARSGLKLFREQSFDLCILDVMMPEMNGFELTQRIRILNDEIPIIFLTARSLKVDKLKGFGLGADDYIVKPVDEEELVARIQAVLRRTKKRKKAHQEYEIGRFIFEEKNQRLFLDGKEFKTLTEREARLLKLLCENQGNLLQRKDVLQSLWGKNDYFSRRSMDVFISRLRNYFSEDARIQITNVHGSGFILSVKEDGK